MKRILNWFPAIALILMFAGYALAQAPAASPSPAASAVAAPAAAAPVVAAPPLDLGSFLSQVLSAVQGFGGLSWMAKVAAILALLIASMRVTVINNYTWAKLPSSLKPLVAPILALIAGLVTVQPFSWAGVLAWVMAGGGALIIDQVLDGIKSEPGLNPLFVSVINFFESLPVIGSGVLTQPVVAAQAVSSGQPPKAS